MQEHMVEVRDSGEWKIVERAFVIDERNGSSPSAETFIKQLSHRENFALEDSLAAKPRKADEIELRQSGGRWQQVSDEAGEQLRLPS